MHCMTALPYNNNNNNNNNNNDDNNKGVTAKLTNCRQKLFTCHSCSIFSISSHWSNF